jgi:hypothetical protein
LTVIVTITGRSIAVLAFIVTLTGRFICSDSSYCYYNDNNWEVCMQY